MANEPSVPVLFDGAFGIYRQVDLETWNDTSTLIPFDSDLKSLGFILVGDLLCSALAQGILRAYVHPEEHTRGLLLVGVKDGGLNVFGLFFDSQFSDGAIATTTTSIAVKDLPDRGIHRKVCAWKNVYDLFGQHQLHLSELKQRHGPAQPMAETLLSISHSIDSFSLRMNE